MLYRDHGKENVKYHIMIVGCMLGLYLPPKTSNGRLKTSFLLTLKARICMGTSGYVTRPMYGFYAAFSSCFMNPEVGIELENERNEWKLSSRPIY